MFNLNKMGVLKMNRDTWQLKINKLAHEEKRHVRKNHERDEPKQHKKQNSKIMRLAGLLD